MPSYLPYNRGRNRPCPTIAAKPWRARAKRDGVQYNLGHFATREEALEEERIFDEWHPRRPHGHDGPHQREDLIHARP